MVKVLVLNPPVHELRFSRDGRCQSEEGTWLDTFPPTAFASIAGAVREVYDVKVIDCIGSKISFDDCMVAVREFGPQFTVLNTATPTIRADMEVAKCIKEETGSKIIVYGEHVTARFRSLFREYKYIDFCVLGEPETPIMNILSGKAESPGVATRKFDGGIWQEPDLDKLPFPAYDLFPDYFFPLTGEKWMFVRSGRGCPYNCIYCVMPMMSNRRVRYHSAEYMVRQFKWLSRELGICLYMLWDEISTADRKHMEEMCELIIKEGLEKEIKWFCTTRVDRFDFDLAKKMRRAGCRMVSFGIESGNQKVLDVNGKGITLEQTRKAVCAAQDAGIRIIGHFIVGLVGSSPKTERETIDFAKDLKIDFAQFYIATPFPGSKFYQMARKNKWFEGDNWDAVEQGTAVVSYPDFSAKEIQEWRRRAYKEFYFRPHAIWAGLTMMSFGQLLRLPKYLSTFVGWMKK